MAEVVFLVLCVAGAVALAMHRAPLWAWAAALAGGGRPTALARICSALVAWAGTVGIARKPKGRGPTAKVEVLAQKLAKGLY